MNRLRYPVVSLVCLAVLAGCHSVSETVVGPPADYKPFVQQIEYPDAATAIPLNAPESFAAPPTLSNYENLQAWPLTLDEAIRIALNNSDVMRDLGGRVLNTPAAVSTTYDPALQETNPQNGVEAALSQFDAQLRSGIFFDRQENKFNNEFFGGGASSLQANLGEFILGVNKTAATGTQFAFRNRTNYDRNNSPINRFYSVYNTLFQAEIRHPLLQGAGVEFNRIAGPSQIPGVYNGVLVARVNNDITLAQFETAVRDLLFSVEQTYWQLYQAYREFDTRQRARHASGEIWRQNKEKVAAGREAPDTEAQARQRYYAFQAQVENALTGTAQTVGVFRSERDLRRLLGLAPADGRIIRPATPPTTAKVIVDWNASVVEALGRRVELRQQRWLVRRREMEAVAARNYAKARMDLIGLYGWKGFGDDLLGNRNVPEGSAFADLFGGDLQDWRLGLELTTPIGNRVGHAAVRNAQLQLARDRAVLRDQEVLVTHQLAAAVAEKERALANVRSTSNSRDAAIEEITVLEERYSVGNDNPFFLFDAQQRLADSESALHRALADYNIALLGVEYSRGTLLSYMEVSLAEGPWSQPAQVSAAKQLRKLTPRVHNPIPADHIKVSNGPFNQSTPIMGAPDAAAATPGETLPPPKNADEQPSAISSQTSAYGAPWDGKSAASPTAPPQAGPLHSSRTRPTPPATTSAPPPAVPVPAAGHVVPLSYQAPVGPANPGASLQRLPSTANN